MTEEERAVFEDETSELAGDNIESLREALAKEKEKAEGYLANWQRTEADFRNHKKREAQEKKDLINWANSALVCDVLPVLDAFDRAFEVVGTDDKKHSWITGFKQIQKMLLDILGKHGLAEMKCVGDKFDPSLHEAVAQQEGAEGVILDDVRRGYKLRDKVLRAPQVIVGKVDESASTVENEKTEENLTGEED